MRIARRVLQADKTVGEFTAVGEVRIWVRHPGGAWPGGGTVKLQEKTDDETPRWEDEETWTAEGKHFKKVVGSGSYRILASQTGFVARVDTYAENVEVVV